MKYITQKVHIFNFGQKFKCLKMSETFNFPNFKHQKQYSKNFTLKNKSSFLYN